jgi:hypothetical protein
MKKAPFPGLISSFFPLFSRAEGMGFEPTTHCWASDFESDGHLVFPAYLMVFFLLRNQCAAFSRWHCLPCRHLSSFCSGSGHAGLEPHPWPRAAGVHQERGQHAGGCREPVLADVGFL